MFVEISTTFRQCIAIISNMCRTIDNILKTQFTYIENSSNYRQHFDLTRIHIEYTWKCRQPFDAMSRITISGGRLRHKMPSQHFALITPSPSCHTPCTMRRLEVHGLEQLGMVSQSTTTSISLPKTSTTLVEWSRHRPGLRSVGSYFLLLGEQLQACGCRFCRPTPSSTCGLHSSKHSWSRTPPELCSASPRWPSLVVPQSTMKPCSTRRCAGAANHPTTICFADHWKSCCACRPPTRRVRRALCNRE